ncbi:MAG: MotA/TolQ/ExbB proton channel family protein [Opitutales bacterium]
MRKLIHTLSILTATAFAFSPIGIQGQSLDQVNKKADEDLREALDQLAEIREEIADEKIPLVREVSSLEDEVRQKSAELERLRRLRDNRDNSLNELNDQVSAMEEQNDYVAGLLDEFVRSFESRIDFSETQLYAEAAEEARLALEDSDMAQHERFEKQLNVVETAQDRLEKIIGGYTFEGKARTPDGEIETGKFAVYGPSVYFASDQSGLAGITYSKLNAAEAAIAAPGEEYIEGIRTLVETGEGNIPVDGTLGKALRISESSETVLEHFAKGGGVGYVIIALGVVCLLIGIFKIFEVTRFKTPSAPNIQKVLGYIESGEPAKAKAAAADIPGAGGELIQNGVEHREEKRGTLEEILYEKILAVRPRLERLLPFLALTAAAAPLLGLLGTVTGMIKTFNLITIFGTGDAKNLSSGISEALVTTELGLMVAIPTLILHGLLARIAKQKIGDMEQTAVAFINGVIGARHLKDTDKN